MGSRRPVLYVGGGCLDCPEEVRELVARTGIPVTQTLMGLGAFPESHPLALQVVPPLPATVVCAVCALTCCLLRHVSAEQCTHLSRVLQHLQRVIHCLSGLMCCVLQMLGMHGTVAANYAIDKADLLLAIGVRFDDRVTGKLEAFAARARIVHIDIDPAEINKNKASHITVCADAKSSLQVI